LDSPVSSASTVAIPAKAAPASSGSIDEGRFPAGTLLAGRYKVIGLVGRGGMGEVYRANDVKLGQAVALKFLPERTAITPQALARFHNEVRVARQVSHPNVCRVYDIGEAEGLVFISMEYVDGEDLGSLLRRIGRLPGDKALEIGRRLCAGLAAAHDKGVLHRDLKPGNVMIDGRGHVLITDFGLAGMAGQVEGGEIRNGTPAYMAPEQIAGREVSAQSDIYSLGLVLYEMFTGKQAFRDRTRGAAPPGVSSLVKDADPAVERVIQRCLEDDPRNRPSSALAVAAALPGGDLLAAALAAGETPSPDMVAAAGGKQCISVRTAMVCLVCILAGLVGVVVVGDRANLLRKIPFDKSGEVLAAKSREWIHQFGFTERPADSAFGFNLDWECLRYVQSREKPAALRALLATGQPPAVFFWYRQGPRALVPQSADGVVTEIDPNPEAPGAVRVILDPDGRLLSLSAAPPISDEALDTPPPPADWGALLAAAGLDPARLVPIKPKLALPVAFDTRVAWTGTYAHAPEIPLRIEAASWKGRPAFFLLLQPWREAYVAAGQYTPSSQEKTSFWVNISLTSSLFIVATLLAARNYRLGRGDGRGAFRLALFVMGLSLLEWASRAKHHAASSEYGSFILGLSAALFTACVFGVLYLALEPYVRRRWPESIITWTRLLAGGVRDPLVGGHALVGVAAGILVSIAFFAENLLVEPYGSPQHGPDTLVLTWVEGARPMAGTLLVMVRFAIGIGLFLFFLFFLSRVASRRHWLGTAVFVLVSGVFWGLPSANVPLGAVFGVLLALEALFLLVRFGVLALVVNVIAGLILSTCPMTTDFSAWYAGSMLVAIGAVLALAAYAFHTALAGRPLFKAGFLEE